LTSNCLNLIPCASVRLLAETKTSTSLKIASLEAALIDAQKRTPVMSRTPEESLGEEEEASELSKVGVQH